MYPGPSARKFGGSKFEILNSKDGVHKIATFPTAIQGAAAQFDLLASNGYTGRSIKDAIQKWCGGFYVSTYIKVLEEQAGVSRDTILTRDLLCNASVAVPLAKAMAWQEAGQEFPLADDDWVRAHQMVFPDAVGGSSEVLKPSPVVDTFENDNDVPSPKPETRIRNALSGSKTIMGGLAAFIGTIVQYFDDAMKSLMDAAAQVASWGPASGLLGTLGVNAKAVGFGVAVGGVALVMHRRIDAARKGKIG